MTQRIKLKNLIEAKLLQPNEEIYMEFRGLHFTGRVLENGDLKTDKGTFKTMPAPTFLNLMEDKKYKKWYFEKVICEPIQENYEWKDLLESRKGGKRRKKHIVSGWSHWKTWNGTTLDELRKKLSND